MMAPSSMSVRRDNPLHITLLPGGGSWALATFRRKNALSDIGRVTLHATDIVFRGDFARVHSRTRGEWTVPA